MKAAARRITTIATVAVAAAALTAVGGRGARGGRTHYGWVPATEVVPERAVELETWILEENGVGDDDVPDGTPDETAIWWTTVVGLTDQIELGLPIEIKSLEGAGSGDPTLLYGFGADLRWRLVSPDPMEAGRLAPALRIGAHRLVNTRDRVRGSAGVGLGVDVTERLHVATDVGATSIVGDDDSTLELAPSAGVSVRVIGQLRLGGEVHGQFTLRGEEKDWLAAGPNLAWTHGRFWIAAALPLGLFEIRTAPRINWAVAF